LAICGAILLVTLLTPVSRAGVHSECVAYSSLEKEYEAAVVVFVGRVMAVDYIPGRECCHVLSGHATLEVDRWWKGQPAKRLKIGAVGQIFEVGNDYVVFGFGNPLVADGCNSTKTTKDSASTLRWLAKKPYRRAA